MTPPEVRDPGLQPERTALSWRRTALAVAVGSLVALRVLPVELGSPLWYLPGVLGVVVAGWIWWVSLDRYRRFGRVLVQHTPGQLPGAGALAALATCVSVVGVIAGIAVVSAH